MTNQTQNLFIVEDNPESALKLHQFLDTRFGTVFNISTFTDAVTALSKVDENTSVVVLDYDYFGIEGNKIVDFIKNINKKTKVIKKKINSPIATESKPPISWRFQIKTAVEQKIRILEIICMKTMVLNFS